MSNPPTKPKPPEVVCYIRGACFDMSWPFIIGLILILLMWYN